MRKVLVAGLENADNQICRAIKSYGFEIEQIKADAGTRVPVLDAMILVKSCASHAVFYDAKEKYKQAKKPFWTVGEGFSEIKEDFEQTMIEPVRQTMKAAGQYKTIRWAIAFALKKNEKVKQRDLLALAQKYNPEVSIENLSKYVSRNIGKCFKRVGEDVKFIGVTKDMYTTLQKDNLLVHGLENLKIDTSTISAQGEATVGLPPIAQLLNETPVAAPATPAPKPEPMKPIPGNTPSIGQASNNNADLSAAAELMMEENIKATAALNSVNAKLEALAKMERALNAMVRTDPILTRCPMLAELSDEQLDKLEKILRVIFIE